LAGAASLPLEAAPPVPEAASEAGLLLQASMNKERLRARVSFASRDSIDFLLRDFYQRLTRHAKKLRTGTHIFNNLCTINQVQNTVIT
jgi:hypothetical protein